MNGSQWGLIAAVPALFIMAGVLLSPLVRSPEQGKGRHRRPSGWRS